MIICEFVSTGYNTAKCVRCHNTIQMLDGIDSFPIFPCRSVMSELFDKDNIKIDTIKSQITQDNTSHDGLTQCSDEEISLRYSVCKGCEYFDNNTCKECGCVLSRDREFLNKLVWKDQSCPKNKW